MVKGETSSNSDRDRDSMYSVFRNDFDQDTCYLRMCECKQIQTVSYERLYD